MIAMKQSGQKESSLSKRYRLGNSTISRWEQEVVQEQSQSPPLPLTDEQIKDIRLKELEFDFRKLQEEHEIMKTALSLLCKKKIET
jgi:hypothetical protein